jgi:hypothetical protein
MAAIVARTSPDYQHFIPLPRTLLLLALLRYRDRDAWLLLLAAPMPQRWFFDSFILWLIPKSRHQILPTLCFSWGTGIRRWYHLPASFAEVGRVAVKSIDLPRLQSCSSALNLQWMKPTVSPWFQSYPRKHTLLTNRLLPRTLRHGGPSVIRFRCRWRFKIGEYIAKHKVSLTPTHSPTPAPPGPRRIAGPPQLLSVRN